LKDLALTGWKDKRKVMQQYDLTAQMYDELYAEEQKAKYETALQNVAVSSTTVLDVGCGSGLFYREVASQASVVVGVDISRKLLMQAKVQADFFGNVFVLQADADHLPFQDGFFDAVFAFTVLQNMPKPAETLIELKRVTGQKGRLVVTALKKAFALHTFMDLVELAGFRVVSFVDDEALKCYVSVLALNKLKSDTLPVSAQIPTPTSLYPPA
jgi:ubiquinone/menaquinone biosynthesis C-methylase UbiE